MRYDRRKSGLHSNQPMISSIQSSQDDPNVLSRVHGWNKRNFYEMSVAISGLVRLTQCNRVHWPVLLHVPMAISHLC